MEKNLNKRILEAVKNAIELALDDYEDDEPIITPTKDVIQVSKHIQGAYGMYKITQKFFIYELLKRLPNVKKTEFAKFGFVNDKIPSYKLDWPCIIYTDRKLSEAHSRRVQKLFDTAGWTTITGISTFSPILKSRKDIFPAYNTTFDNDLPAGPQAIQKQQEKHSYWMEEFKGKFKECYDVIEKLAIAHENLKNVPLIFIDQISFSNDGAFYAIFYQDLDGRDPQYKNKYINRIEIYCTPEILKDDTDINEEKDIKSKQRKFKNYLTKKLLYGEDKFPQLLIPGQVNKYVAFGATVLSTTELDYRIRVHARAKEAKNRMDREYFFSDKFMSFALFVMHSFNRALYIDEKYTYTQVYDKLTTNEGRPYIVLSSENGDYLVAYYCSYMGYDKNARPKYQLSYYIIDNRNYDILEKRFLSEIQYNHID